MSGVWRGFRLVWQDDVFYPFVLGLFSSELSNQARELHDTLGRWSWLAAATVWLAIGSFNGFRHIKRHSAEPSPTAGPAPDQMRAVFLDLGGVVRPMYEFAEGQRAELERRGWSPSAAEACAQQTLQAMLGKAFGGNA